MHVYELRYPGIRPTGLDDEAAHALTSVVGLTERGVAEAAVSLHFFEQARSDMLAQRPQPPSPEEWQQEAAFERAIEARLLDQLPAELAAEQRWAAHDRAREEARQEVKRQAWRAGRVARQLPKHHLVPVRQTASTALPPTGSALSHSPGCAEHQPARGRAHARQTAGQPEN